MTNGTEGVYCCKCGERLDYTVAIAVQPMNSRKAVLPGRDAITLWGSELIRNLAKSPGNFEQPQGVAEVPDSTAQGGTYQPTSWATPDLHSKHATTADGGDPKPDWEGWACEAQGPTVDGRENYSGWRGTDDWHETDGHRPHQSEHNANHWQWWANSDGWAGTQPEEPATTLWPTRQGDGNSSWLTSMADTAPDYQGQPQPDPWPQASYGNSWNYIATDNNTGGYSSNQTSWQTGWSDRQQEGCWKRWHSSPCTLR